MMHIAKRYNKYGKFSKLIDPATNVASEGKEL